MPTRIAITWLIFTANTVAILASHKTRHYAEQKFSITTCSHQLFWAKSSSSPSNLWLFNIEFMVIQLIQWQNPHQIYKFALSIRQWFSTGGSRFAGVDWDLQKFLNKFIQRCSQNLFYFNVSYWIMSQVFCSDIMFLFPRHQLCVKQDFQFARSSSDYLLPRQVHLVKVATPLIAGLHL